LTNRTKLRVHLYELSAINIDSQFYARKLQKYLRTYNWHMNCLYACVME